MKRNCRLQIAITLLLQFPPLITCMCGAAPSPYPPALCSVRGPGSDHLHNALHGALGHTLRALTGLCRSPAWTVWQRNREEHLAWCPSSAGHTESTWRIREWTTISSLMKIWKVYSEFTILLLETQAFDLAVKLKATFRYFLYNASLA